MLLNTTPILAPTDKPAPTAVKRIADFQAGKVDVGRPTGLDVAAINRKYHPSKARDPKWKLGSFPIPVPCRGAAYEKARNEAVQLFISAMARMGWEWTGRKITVVPGVYPYHDIRDQRWDENRREMIVGTWFRYTLEPKPLRLHVPENYRNIQPAGQRDGGHLSGGGSQEE